MKSQRVMVTGSDGYIGSELTHVLQKKGHHVIGLDTRFYRNCYFGGRRILPTILHRDVRKVEEKDLKHVGAIIHLAALSNDPMGALNPTLTDEINHRASVRLAMLAKRAGVKRFIFSSSCSIYGIAQGTVDETSPVNPLTAYARSKIDTEKALKKLADDTFCVCLLRNSTVYGYSPKFRYDLVINNMVANAVTTGEIRIMSDGTPWRPLIDVRDLSRIFAAFLSTPSAKVNGEVFNIGFNTNNIQVKAIADETKKQLPRCSVVYTGEHGKDSRSYKVSFDKFQKTFPRIRQQWPMEKSIRDLITRMKKYRLDKRALDSGVFTRINTLESLMQSKKLTSALYWRHS